MSFLKALPAAALLFLPPSAATVHSVSVVPSSGKTDVVIGINAAVDVQNFTLDAPARVVVDLKGADLAMTQRSYDRISRGGITNIRYSQFRPNVVRVVIDLDAKHAYDVKRSDTEVRITFSGGKTTEYSSWSSNKDGYVAAPTPPPTHAVSAPAEAKKTPSAVARLFHENAFISPRREAIVAELITTMLAEIIRTKKPENLPLAVASLTSSATNE